MLKFQVDIYNFEEKSFVWHPVYVIYYSCPTQVHMYKRSCIFSRWYKQVIQAFK